MTNSGASKFNDVPDVYHSRKPTETAFYQCVEDYFEEFMGVYEDRFESKFGFWRSHIKDVIYRYLECGDLHNGFARVRCVDCGHEFLIAFSCKRRHFCSSCHQKRVIEFGEFLCVKVLKKVPHRHVVFSLPKMLRRYFLYDRKLLADLSRCAWESLKMYLQAIFPEENAVPGVVVAVQTFGDFLSFHPHCHVLVTDGCFLEDGNFISAPFFDSEKLEEIFKQKVFQFLLAKEKISEELVNIITSWRYSGFHVFCGKPIPPEDENAMESIARYIIRASISQERMVYIPEQGKVVYSAKNGQTTKEFDPLEWLAAVCSHIPNPRQQTIRYYGYYSNVSRGKREKEGTDNILPSISESLLTGKEFRRNWARLIQKIYEVDPLLCPKCNGSMKIISFIEEKSVIEKILKHLNLWLVQSRSPPRSIKKLSFDDDVNQEFPPTDDFFPDPEIPWEAY